MSTKRASTKKTHTSSNTTLEQVIEQAKEIVHAGLGVYGNAYDAIMERVQRVRGDSTTEWKNLVARGELMRTNISEKVENFDGEVTFEIPIYIDLDETRSDLVDLRANIEERFAQLKARFQPA